MAILATIAKPDYNNVITANPTGSTYAYSASTGVLDANFAGTIGTTDSIQILTQGYQFAWKPDTVNVLDDAGNLTLLDNVNPNATAQVWNNKITYVGTTAATSDEFVVEGNQLKHSVRMVAPPTLPSGFTGTPQFLAIGGDIGTTAQDWVNVDLYADGVSHRTDFVTSDDLSFVEIASGKEIYRIPKITVTDDAGDEVNGQYKLVFGANNTVTLYMLCPWNWMQSATYPIIIDPTVIVSGSYDISGNGGRRIARLSNGNIGVLFRDAAGTGTAHLYQSIDNGQTWSSIWSVGTQYAGSEMAFATDGTNYYAALEFYGSSSQYTLTVYCISNTGSVIANNAGLIATGTESNPFNGISIEVDGTGAIHLAWSDIVSTYPNSANIRYSKGTLSGTTLTFSTPTQITSDNTSGTNWTNPDVTVDSSNNPHISVEKAAGSSGGIFHYKFTSGTWSSSTVYYTSSNTQNSPCEVLDSNGVIHDFWSSLNSATGNFRNIVHTTSSDGGNTWTNPTYVNAIAYHQDNATVSADSNNNLYLFYQQLDASGYLQIFYMKYTASSGTWSSATAITSATSNSGCSNPQALWSEFNMNSSDQVRVIYENVQSSAVDYYTITLDSPPNAPTLNPVANFDATKATTFSWMFSDPDPGDSQSAFQLQILEVAAGTTAVDTGKVASTNTSYTVAANTLSNAKQYQWRVTTWDSSGQQGPYSAYSTFNTAGAPTTTVTSPSNNSSITTSSLTAQWSYSDPNNYAQQSFQVQLLASDDLTILADSGTVNSTGNQYTIPYTLANNTTYFVSVRTTNSQGVTSAWASATFSTSFTLPQQPSVTASSFSTQAKITIAMTNYASKNLVLNSGFEVVTTTATVFSDALTSYTGSTVPAPWTKYSSSAWTFGANGATTTANNSYMTAGNVAWVPLLGSDGSTKLALKVQATCTTPSTLSTGTNGSVCLWINGSSYYMAYISNSLFKITKTGSTIASVAFNAATSTAYTITLSLDPSGVVTATVTPSGGSTTTLTYTDSSPLTGGFLIGVGGDTGVVISNASCVGPWANSWTVGGDSRVAWGLTQSAIGGKYSVSAVGVESGVLGIVFENFSSFTTGSSYIASAYVNTQSVGTTNGAFLRFGNTGGSPLYVLGNKITGTTSTNRTTLTETVPPGTTTLWVYCCMNDSGTVTFDNIQLEQGSSATPYIENDSISSPQQAPAIAYNDIYRRNTGTSAWTRIATNVNPSSTYDDYAVASGQWYDYKVTAIGNNGTTIDSAVVTTSVNFTGDWLYNPTSGQQFQFLYNRKAYSLAITEERKEVQTFGTKPMIRRGPQNARTGTLDALMVKVGTGQTPIQQLQAFEADMSPHNAYYLKTAAGEVFKVDLYQAARSMPAENLNNQAIGVSVNWTEIA